MIIIKGGAETIALSTAGVFKTVSFDRSVLWEKRGGKDESAPSAHAGGQELTANFSRAPRSLGNSLPLCLPRQPQEVLTQADTTPQLLELNKAEGSQVPMPRQQPLRQRNHTTRKMTALALVIFSAN